MQSCETIISFVIYVHPSLYMKECNSNLIFVISCLGFLLIMSTFSNFGQNQTKTIYILREDLRTFV